MYSPSISGIFFIVFALLLHAIQTALPLDPTYLACLDKVSKNFGLNICVPENPTIIFGRLQLSVNGLPTSSLCETSTWLSDMLHLEFYIFPHPNVNILDENSFKEFVVKNWELIQNEVYTPMLDRLQRVFKTQIDSFPHLSESIPAFHAPLAEKSEYARQLYQYQIFLRESRTNVRYCACDLVPTDVKHIVALFRRKCNSQHTFPDSVKNELIDLRNKLKYKLWYPPQWNLHISAPPLSLDEPEAYPPQTDQQPTGQQPTGQQPTGQQPVATTTQRGLVPQNANTNQGYTSTPEQGQQPPNPVIVDPKAAALPVNGNNNYNINNQNQNQNSPLSITSLNDDDSNDGTALVPYLSFIVVLVYILL
ncbi:hypothetical protein HMI54_005872 [Coelomomyces lativittatus]|nr:hypothetical protein HMI54_005872 [Coelomomyces lativittatus]KAJ1514218.1 hypothetical protein HMI56_000911 [Coelomomyces lativittatus]KAJ1517380.1 hypothetical protein HMI55_007253 [Coelomomyces lativittatus]